MKHHVQNSRVGKDISPLKGKIFLLLGVILVIILSSTSFIYGWKNTPSQMQFLGRRTINLPDTYPQLALIEQGRSDRLLFLNLYDSSTRSAYIVSPVNLVLGQIAGRTNLPNILVFHIGRIVLGLFLLCAVYHLLKLFFSRRKDRLFAFLFISLSSGFGLFLFRFLTSYDLFLPTSNLFLSLMESPELIFQEILLILSFMGVIRMIINRKFHLGYILLILSSLGVLLGNTIYNYPRPRIIAELLPFLMGTGFSLPAVLFIRKKIENLYHPLSLALFFAVLFFIPTPFQWLSYFGFYIFLSIAAVKGYIYIYDQYIYSFISKNKIFKFLGLVLTLLVIFILFPATNYFHLYWDMQNYGKDKIDAYSNYLLIDEMQGINWMKEHVSAGSIVLAKPFYSNIISGLTGLKTFLGDDIHTPFNTEKLNDIDGLLNIWMDTNRIDYMKRNNIGYIFFGKDDSMLKGSLQPDQTDYLKKIYNQGGVTVYKFIPPQEELPAVSKPADLNEKPSVKSITKSATKSATPASIKK